MVNASDFGFCSNNDRQILVDVCLRELQNVPIYAKKPARDANNDDDDDEDEDGPGKNARQLRVGYLKLLLACYEAQLRHGALGLASYKLADVLSALENVQFLRSPVTSVLASITITITIILTYLPTYLPFLFSRMLMQGRR